MPPLNEINYFFIQEAFKFAFEGNNSEIIITKEGDVYKDSIDDFNLVVSFSGEIGPAGGGPVAVKINDMNMGAISNPVEYTRQLCEYFIRQLNLQTAVAKDLDFLGFNIFNIKRRAGEGDAGYRARIVKDIFAIKGTPLSIRDSISEFADKVVIDDDITSGAFANVTFSNFFKEFVPPNVPDSPSEPGKFDRIVMGAFAGRTGGLRFMYNVILTNPDQSKAVEIIRILKDFTVGGVVFNIFVE